MANSLANSQKNRGPRSNRRHPNIKVLGPRGLERETLTGVTVVVSLSDFDLVKGGGAAGRRGLDLGSAVYLIGWRRGWGMIVFRPDILFWTD